MTKTPPLSLALHLARMWRTFEVRDGKVFAVGEDSGKAVCTTAILQRMVKSGWMAQVPRRRACFELTREGMRAWIAQQEKEMKR